MSGSNIRHCEDCKWYRPCMKLSYALAGKEFYNNIEGLSKCHYPEFTLVSPDYSDVLCTEQRRSGGRCGFKGALWEAK